MGLYLIALRHDLASHFESINIKNMNYSKIGLDKLTHTLATTKHGKDGKIYQNQSDI